MHTFADSALCRYPHLKKMNLKTSLKKKKELSDMIFAHQIAKLDFGVLPLSTGTF